MVFGGASVCRGKLLEDALPLVGVTLADSGTVDDYAVGVDGHLGRLARHFKVTDHRTARRSHFSRMAVCALGGREGIQRLIERDSVEVNLILERGIDGANAPQRGATVRSPRRVEEYEDRFPLGNEIG